MAKARAPLTRAFLSARVDPFNPCLVRLLRSLARDVATQVATTTLAADTAESGEGPIKKQTVGGYGYTRPDGVQVIPIAALGS